MNPSTFNSESTEMNSNFSFSSQSIPRSGLVFTKSRLSKRRGINRPNLKPSDSQPGPAVNPFMLGSEYSSVLGSPRPGPGVGGSSVIGEYSGLRSKDSGDDDIINSGKGEGVIIIEELRNLKIGINNEEFGVASVNAKSSCLDAKFLEDEEEGSSIASKLHDNLRKLNIQGSEKNGPSLKFKKEDGSKPGRNYDSTLPDELQNKLNLYAVEISKQGDHSFTERSAGAAAAVFPDQVKKNFKGTAAKRDDQTLDNNASFLFGGRGGNTSSDCTGVTECLLSNAMEKILNIGTESSASHQQNRDGFSFTSRKNDIGTPLVDFKTPSSKVSHVSGFNQTVELTAERDKIDSSRLKKKKKRGKLRQPMQVQPQIPQYFDSTESISHELDAFMSYSPMDVSPCPETLEDNRFSRETSVTSDESISIDQNFTSNDSEQPVSNDAVDEVLVAAAQRMEINGDDEVKEVVGDDTAEAFERGVGNEGPCEGYTSATETESFKSATDEIDLIRDAAASSAEKTEASCSSSLEKKDSGGTTQYFSCSQSEETAESNFTFSAFSAAQGQYLALKRNNKKKPSSKASYSSHNVEIPNPSSSTLSFTSSVSSPFLSPQLERGSRPTSQYKDAKDSKINMVKDGKLECSSPTAVTMAAQEACEKWRLRGNQAYTSGHMSKAEDCYTQGINCIPKSEMSRSCLRALMLCYSNRAATRMSLGRMRDALADCLMATEIDPNFLKVLLRAANCYLALGEIEEALHYHKKCLQASSEVCVDRKIAIEASEGIQKAQKVSQCINDSTELLLARTSKDAERSLEIIAEALVISACSDKLIEMKAEALLLLQRYQEVIQLCEQTLDLAGKNSLSVGVDNQPGNSSEFSKRLHFRFWRCLLSFKSFFHLGKLEEGLASLEKQAEQLLGANRNGYTILESSIPLVKTVREVIHLKTAGNEAFQAGKHAEAVDHYTAALFCNLESRPFAAICFCNRAAAYKALGQITDAIADCSLAIALDGNYWKAISRRATLYEMIRDYGQAGTDLDRLVFVLTKQQVEEKAGQGGGGGGYDSRSLSCATELRQARIRLSEIEEEAKKDLPLDMYLILGVESPASAADIKKAYRKSALRHHPDKALQYLAKGDGGDEKLAIAEDVYKDADRLFKMIAEAYAVLSDTTKRSRYDVEEETRQKKQRGGGASNKTSKDEPSYPFERNGSNMHQWREVWTSYNNNNSQQQPKGGGSSYSNRWARYK